MCKVIRDQAMIVVIGAMLVLAPTADCQTVVPGELVVDRMLAALGGRDAWASVSNTINDSQQNRVNEPTVVRTVITMDFTRPRFRIETTAPDLHLIRVVDGSRTWRLNRAGVIEDLPRAVLLEDERWYAGHVYRTLHRLAARDESLRTAIGPSGRLEVYEGEARIAWFALDARGEPYAFGAHQDDVGSISGPWEFVADGIRHPIWVARPDGSWRATVKTLEINARLDESIFARPDIATSGASAGEVPGVFDVVRGTPPVEDQGISRGAAWGDCDDDGYPDLFVARPTYDGPIQANALDRNSTGRGFVRVQNDATTERAADWEGGVWVDVDGDGDLDLHIVGRNGAGSVIYRNTGGCGLTRVEPDPLAGRVSSASMACWADVDGDGLLDVFVVGSGEGRNTLFRNMGSWRFEHVELSDLAAGAGASRACAFGDLDGDGLPELAVVNARQPNLLLRNRGGMSLAPDTAAPLWRDTAYGYGVSWTDVNGDGIRDLFVANFDASNSLYAGRPDGTLELVALGNTLQSPASKGHAWGDFDLDGQLDLYLGSGTPRPGMVNQLYLGAGSGRFRLETKGEFATHADTSAAVAAADYDSDGALDLFVANWGSPSSVNRLYRNTNPGRAWLKVRLEGVRSNRMGIGARASILLTLGGERRWLHRWLDASTGYAGQNEPVLHFGLGDAEHVDSLSVLWPSGVLDRFGVVPARTTVAVTEGSATLKACALPLTSPSASSSCRRNKNSVEMFRTEPSGARQRFVQ